MREKNKSLLAVLYLKSIPSHQGQPVYQIFRSAFKMRTGRITRKLRSALLRRRSSLPSANGL